MNESEFVAVGVLLVCSADRNILETCTVFEEFLKLLIKRCS